MHSYIHFHDYRQKFRDDLNTPLTNNIFDWYLFFSIFSTATILLDCIGPFSKTQNLISKSALFGNCTENQHYAVLHNRCSCSGIYTECRRHPPLYAKSTIFLPTKNSERISTIGMKARTCLSTLRHTKSSSK